MVQSMGLWGKWPVGPREDLASAGRYHRKGTRPAQPVHVGWSQKESIGSGGVDIVFLLWHQALPGEASANRQPNRAVVGATKW